MLSLLRYGVAASLLKRDLFSFAKLMSTTSANLQNPSRSSFTRRLFLGRSYLLVSAVLNYIVIDDFRCIWKFTLECEKLKGIGIIQPFLSRLKDRRPMKRCLSTRTCLSLAQWTRWVYKF